MEVYKTHGTCSSRIEFEVVGNIVTHINIIDGCRGNTQGVARLAEGRDIDEIISLTKGIQCHGGTSCPDQLSKALEEYKQKHNI